MTARMNTNEYEINDDGKSFTPSGNAMHDSIVIEIILSNLDITREGTEKCFREHRESKEKTHVASIIDVIFKGQKMPNGDRNPRNCIKSFRIDEPMMQRRAIHLRKDFRAGKIIIEIVDRVQQGSEDDKEHYMMLVFEKGKEADQRRVCPLMFYIFGIITDPDEPIIFTKKENRDAIYNYITAPKK